MIDYLGFTEDEDKIQNENDTQYFSPHLSLEEAVNKIKKGQLFEGKLNISRTNHQDGNSKGFGRTLGTVLLGKYGFDVKINGKENLNRALNGDRVCIELLPESGKHIELIKD